MITTHLVLVALLVYTFHVSKTMFQDNVLVLMRIRGHGTRVVGIYTSFIAGRTDVCIV